ncbi:MAG: TatD family hydrolase [Gemmatimonadota bacterium]
MKLVDTHAHLTDEKLAPEAAEVVARAQAAGIEWLVTIASDLADSARAIAAAERFAGVYATVGVHPHAADTVDGGTFDRLRELAAHPKVVALGETGLDFHYDNSPRDAQRDAFERHLTLAAELDLPVVVHARDADTEVAEIIRAAGWRRGALHCFSSGSALLEAALELDWYISFAGMITFKRWDAGDLLCAVPDDRILVETDSPYLAPVPHRGKRNEPAYVRLVAERAAELRGQEPEAFFATTTRNARAFYRLDM